MAINYFNFFMVIINERLFLYRAYFCDSKHFLPSLQTSRTFQIFHLARYAFQRKGVSRSSYQELCAHLFYPSSIAVLKQEVLSFFSKKQIMKLNTNIKYKIIQFENIWRCVPSSHSASVAARLHKTVK